MENVKYRGYDSPFAQRLRALIDQKGIKHVDLADKDVLNVSRQSIGQYCDGSSIPPIDKIVILSKYFEVSTDYLLGLTDVKTTDTNVKAICEYTGLSEESIEVLNNRITDANGILADIMLEYKHLQTKSDVFLDMINFLLSESNYFFAVLEAYSVSLFDFLQMKQRLDDRISKSKIDNKHKDFLHSFDFDKAEKYPLTIKQLEQAEELRNFSEVSEDEFDELYDFVLKVNEYSDNVFLRRNDILLFVDKMINELNREIKKYTEKNLCIVQNEYPEGSGGNVEHKKD